jgi:hypothetical protein
VPFVRVVRDSPSRRTLTFVAEKSYGRTASGREITDTLIEEFAEEALAGYDVEDLLRRRAVRERPTLGSARRKRAE